MLLLFPLTWRRLNKHFGPVHVVTKPFDLRTSSTRWKSWTRQRQPSQASNHNRSEKMAVFMDGDHVSPSALKSLIDSLSAHGETPLRRVYVAEHKASKWARQLRDHKIELVKVPTLVGGAKEFVNLVIALDAAELALKSDTPEITAVVLASEDTDFVPIHQRMRSYGMRTIAALRDREGRGDLTTAQRHLREAADEVVWFTMNIEESIDAKIMDPSLVVKQRLGSRQDTHGMSSDHDKDIATVAEVLTHLGYLSGAVHDNKLTRGLLAPAIAKFFHVNELGAFTLEPWTAIVAEAYMAITSRTISEWKEDPGDLIFVERLASTGNDKKKYGSTNTANNIRGRGAFICRVSPTLVRDVLQKLGYFEGGSIDIAAEAFSRVNQTMLAPSGVGNDLRKSELVQTLHKVFVEPGTMQLWKVSPRDANVRAYLCKHTYINSTDEAEKLVLVGIQRLLKTVVATNDMPVDYVHAVVLCSRYLDRNDPNWRK